MSTIAPDTVVSSGTLRTEDLVHAFWQALPEEAQNKVLATPDLGVLAHAHDEGIVEEYDTEEYAAFLMALQDALESIAPEGTAFGSHEGDGALFGFWTTGE